MKSLNQASSRSSPVLVADPEIGVMEASTFGRLIGENQNEDVESDYDSVQEPPPLPRNGRVQRYGRRAVAEMLQAEGLNAVAGLKKQQAAETEVKSKDLSQGKMKRANLVFEAKATKKAKQRKSRIKSTSGRNNDRKCQ